MIPRFLRAHLAGLLSSLSSGLLAKRLALMLVLLLAVTSLFAPVIWAAPVPNATQQTVPPNEHLHIPLVVKSFTPINLTAGSGLNAVESAWSPDGTEIAFHDGHSSIYTILVDGSQSKKVVDMEYSGHAAWSPDGSKLVFEGHGPVNEPGFTTDIYLLSFQTDGSTRLTALTHDEELDESPVWAPDGSRIIFGRGRGALGEHFYIYTINVDGSDLKSLTKDPARSDQFPTVSPDGSKIAFVQYQTDSSPYCFRDAYAPISSAPPPPPATSIYVMDADGSNPTAVTPLGCNNAPVWSPDNSKIYFLSAPEYTTDLYVVNVDGTQMTNLTNDEAIEINPQPSPDGSRLLYWAEWRTYGLNYRESHYSLVVMNADGSHKTNLVYTDVPSDFGTTWSPDGSKIAYVDHHDLFVIDLDEQ
jgi:TolB protein